jgi:RimJ/RimL family protein N-acetyltransferase
VPAVIAPFTLAGDHVRLEPLGAHHVPGLVSAAAVDRSTFRFTVVPDGAEAMAAYVEGLVGERAAGRVVPFAQVRTETGEAVGCTRFMELRWWLGRAAPDEVEIGGTWLSANVQRSAVNSEAKLLLLTHAFETWGVWRVALCTDARNEQSRRAIERLGAEFEGILRSHRFALDEDGRVAGPRDSAMFSIVADDWPVVSARLRDRLAGR